MPAPGFDPLHSFDKLLDTIYDDALEVVAYIKRPVETISAKLTWAYFKTMLASVWAFIPPLAVALSGQPTISQEPARKHDDHLTSESQDTEGTTEAPHVFTAFTSASSDFIGSHESPPGGRVFYTIQRSKVLKSTEEDEARRG